jgi:nitroimidazol reductase NimA-like FMN-containing flavoprotein (pyridoxamine 5'-phosphate oxidase superfamily)
MLGVLSASEVESLLKTQFTARLGCHAEGQTYVVPISYAYDGASLVSHSVEGRKLRMMRLNPEVCVEIDDVENLGNWRSVIAWGRFEELGGDDALSAATHLIARFSPLLTSKASQPTHGFPDLSAIISRAIFYRIRLYSKTGRFESQIPL